jgi:malate dehydrogenase (oxaloacetate-decarboxylating)(NADP+)
MTAQTPIMKTALEYHTMDNLPGKIAMHPTKPLMSQRDLSLCYSPGVAAPCLEIVKNIDNIYKYTSKGNMVAVISNGTAVLGLGNLGAAASKPVMEGKAVLFKRFADIDAIDIEIDTENVEEFINVVKYIGHSWGGINLEDIKAPECFIIEARLKELLDIPVFHDDQHGTAIITAAAMINALHITKREFATTKFVINGAGAAAIACIDLIKNMGAKHENVILCDTKGVIYEGRKDGMNEWKAKHASRTPCRTLSDAMVSADVFLGLSAKGAVTQDMVASMAKHPIIFAMANPDPEITPDEIKAVRMDAIIATGRSDYSNQVNNVMGFPYIFRGALDVRASAINEQMKIAAAQAIAELARRPVPNEVSSAYSGAKLQYGADYIIPVPFDPRLITTIPIAVAKAAIESGVAKHNNIDFKKYKVELEGRLNPTSNYMNWIFERMSTTSKRIVFAEGEEEETIKAALMIASNNYGRPILIGRQAKIIDIVSTMGHNNSLDGIEIMNAAIATNTEKYVKFLYKRLQREGFLYRDVARMVKTDRNIFAACMVSCGDADTMVTGLTKSYFTCLQDIRRVIDAKAGNIVFSYSILLSKKHNIIIADNNVHELPSAEELADIAVQTASIARGMGYDPRVALLSFSTFGNPMREKSARIRKAVEILDSMDVDFQYDGEMSAEVALNPELMKLYPFCRLSSSANILIMPALHTASIATGLLQELAGGVFIGPILTGLEHSVQIIPIGSSASEILNFAAIAAVGLS